MIKFYENTKLLSVISKLRGKDTVRATRFSFRWLFGLDLSIVIMREDLEGKKKTAIHEMQHHKDEQELGFFVYRKLYNKQIKDVGYLNNVFEKRARVAAIYNEFQPSVYTNVIIKQLLEG